MSEAPITNSQSGPIRGRTDKNGITSYLGIPYATAPVDKLRWKSPAETPHWSTTREAGAMGAKCPQPPASGFAEAIWPKEKESEDCLNLNVLVPPQPRLPCPVAVWIHGGGFLSGSGAWPNGSNFALNGIIFVSINYRLGPFGFLHLNDLFDCFEGCGGTANLGIEDQILALSWIKENIAAFGGDPSNITVFGESAGAIGIATLLATERSKGLFQKAILQSGAGHQARSPAAATIIARRFLELVGVEPGDSKALYSLSEAAIRDATVQLLMDSPNLESLLKDCDPMGTGMLFMPVIDDILLKSLPINEIANGTAKGVDVIVGVNLDEWRLVMFGAGIEAAQSQPLPNLDQYCVATDRSGSELMHSYRGTDTEKTDQDIVSEIFGDLYFNVPATRLADAQSKHANVYCYRFDWPTPIQKGILGACHGLELPFVFNCLGSTTELVGETPPKILADLLHFSWISFFKTGQPEGKPELWPSYSDTGAVITFNKQTEITNRGLSDHIDLWPNW